MSTVLGIGLYTGNTQQIYTQKMTETNVCHRIMASCSSEKGEFKKERDKAQKRWGPEDQLGSVSSGEWKTEGMDSMFPLKSVE